jgi:putative membrane protein
MPKGFLEGAAKEALTAAIQACEQRSSAEVVVAIRGRAASYLHADLTAAIIAAVATIAFLLYSPWVFPVWSFLVDPLLVGVLAGLATAHLPPVRRLLTSKRAREAWVARAARATFYEKQVRMTSARTGVLVFVALTELRAEVIADVGVLDAVPEDAWAAAIERVQRAVAEEQSGLALANAVARLGEALELGLERGADDLNELPDEVCAT